MPRIKPLPRAKAREDMQTRYDQVFGKDKDPVTDPTIGSPTGTPGTYITVWANAPDVRQSLFNFKWEKAELDPKLREMALIRTGWLVGSQFVYSQHCKMGRDVGLSNDQVEQVPYWTISEIFTPVERAVLSYADAIVLQQGRLHDKIMTVLKKHLPEKQILELTYFTTLYVGHATHSKILRLEYDDVPERIVEIPTPNPRKVQDWTDPSWAKNEAEKHSK